MRIKINQHNYTKRLLGKVDKHPVFAVYVTIVEWVPGMVFRVSKDIGYGKKTHSIITQHVLKEMEISEKENSAVHV